MGCCSSTRLEGDWEKIEYAKGNQFEIAFLVKTKNWAKVSAMIQKGFPIDFNMPRFNCCTLLHKAAQYGATEIVEELAKLKADIDSQDAKGLTPLFYAVREGDLKTMKLLVSLKADVNHLTLQQAKLEDYLPEEREVRTPILEELKVNGYTLRGS
jgi:hypothetical protein